MRLDQRVPHRRRRQNKDNSMDEEFLYLWGRRSKLRQRVLVNRLYYQERQRIFEWREGFVKVVSILAGSIAFSKVANEDIVKLCAIAITCTSAGSLVFNFGNKARDSAKRSAEWALLERDIEAKGERDFTEGDISLWAARCNEIEAGEPSPHERLLEQCNVRACRALNMEIEQPASYFTLHFPPLVIH
jgi:hypothetical protein